MSNNCNVKEALLEVKRKIADVESEMEDIEIKQSIIKAQLIKIIWTDASISRERLREAELVLRLAADTDYQVLAGKLRNLKLIRRLASEEEDRLHYQMLREDYSGD